MGNQNRIKMRVIETKDELDGLLKSESKLVVVDFYADWCGPCKMIGPKVEVLAAKYENVVFVKVNVDENAEASEFYNISAMPTFKFFKNGKEVYEVVGASIEKIEEAVKQNA